MMCCEEWMPDVQHLKKTSEKCISFVRVGVSDIMKSVFEKKNFFSVLKMKGKLFRYSALLPSHGD